MVFRSPLPGYAVSIAHTGALNGPASGFVLEALTASDPCQPDPGGTAAEPP